MYWRMEQAERENSTMRASTGYSDGYEPVLVMVNMPNRVEVEVDNLMTSACVLDKNTTSYDYTTRIVFRNCGPKEIRLHLPLLRSRFCTPNQIDFSIKNEPPWNQNKEIVLPKGESYEILESKTNGTTFGYDFFQGEESRDYGRWCLVFGVPEGENPNKYIVGTVLTKPVRWKIDKNCKYKYYGNK
jgi:hypothetical protein